MAFTFLRADENILYGGSVTTSVGATDSTYVDDWLVDGRGTRPAKGTSGTVTWSATGGNGEVGIVVVHAHNVDAGRTITIGGGVSGSTTGPAARTNGIPVNPAIVIASPATTTNVTVGVASNTVTLTIGELLAGKKRALARSLPNTGLEWGYLRHAIRAENRRGSVPDLDRGVCARWLKASITLSTADRNVVLDWYEGTKDDTKPSAILPLDDVNDCWVVRFTECSVKPWQNGFWVVSMEFEEFPRKRW